MAIQAAELCYAVRPIVILKYSGQLFLSLAALIIPPLAVALYFQEFEMSWRLTEMAALMGLLGAYLSRFKATSSMQLNESMALAALLFIITSLVMSYPLMASGLPFFDALFESISAITTTGLTINPTAAESTPAFLFTRAWIQWFGALAIVVFSLALITQPGIVASIAELQEDDLAGGVRQHSKRLFKIYFLLTIVGIIGTLIFDIGLFDAILFTLSALATGGLSPYNIPFQNLSLPAQCWIMVVCFAGAAPLIFFYRKLFRLKSIPLDGFQILSLFIFCCAATVVLGLCFFLIDQFHWQDVLHHAPLLAIHNKIEELV